MSISPTQRTLQHFRRLKYPAAIVEKWNKNVVRPDGRGVGIRQDLFGIIDILVLHPFRGVLGIQVTGQDFSGHNKKILESKYGKEWLRVPGTALELWAWQKKKSVYVLKLKRYTLDDFQ